MALYSFGAGELGKPAPSDLEKIVALAKGRSIVSFADRGPRHFEIGLSGSVTLRIAAEEGSLEINCFSTANPDDAPAYIIALGDAQPSISAATLETHLHGLRTIYALRALLDSGRASALFEYLAQHPFGDIEKALLPEGE
jgi:hypothetical protein